MTASLRDTIVQIVADVLGPTAARELGDDSGLDITPGWDSMQHLAIVMAIEEELGVRVDPEDLAKHRTIASLTTLTGRLLAGLNDR
jgi:acyl carrier protein